MSCEFRSVFYVVMVLLIMPAVWSPDANSDRGSGGQIVLWHAYRGMEKVALEEAIRNFESDNSGVKVRMLSVPFEVYANKITNSIPRGHGPDLFIFAHERTGDWARAGIIKPFETCNVRKLSSVFLKALVEPLCWDGKLYGYPLAFKSLALFYNRQKVRKPPATLEELVEVARRFTNPDKLMFGLVFQTDEFYHAFPFVTGFGGSIKNRAGRYILASRHNAEAFEFIRHLVYEERIVPEEVGAALVTDFFSRGKSVFAINGPWFVGEIMGRVDFSVSALPLVSKTARQMKPFLTVEGVFLSANSANPGLARRLALYIAGEQGAEIRFEKGYQCVAIKGILKRLRAADGKGASLILRGFYEQLPNTVPMPNDPQMRSLWEPAKRALGRTLRGQTDAMTALAFAEKLFAFYTAPPPAPASPEPYILVFSLILFFGVIYLVRKVRRGSYVEQIRKASYVYLYLLPGIVAVCLLVFVPFFVGAAVSLFCHVEGRFTFVGFRNFIRILFSSQTSIFEPLNFYTTLMVTCLWTVSNVVLHVIIGVCLALFLEKRWIFARGLWRVVLIVPWALPNYITALIWKGMFHRQLGAINSLLSVFGIEPVSWFSKFSTAFAANLITNTWLGFPFMMVVTLGALQSIPKEVVESAQVDGAGSWMIFWKIKLPLLKPALVPAVLLGTIWTFNMFNIIYLVSGGEPGGATDILISDAYRWAFERHQQYGYASAYGVLIFIILFLFSKIQMKISIGQES